ncbi:nuclear transport factor 2 family protein [Frankia sp. Cppng1_Ct_nod]|uniref:nuclear transport factor 2 family protein n=1 Tax=Frankia sp. Cppng1_Ct_nod TaxID=2897162 RepID=UPI0010412C3E|nr:nuclear transport factor 2 family protein [Frankia sp. Cppng1_Ct_nod]
MNVITNVITAADVVDRLAVEETLHRYWSHIDAGNFTAVRALFTDDARGRYWGGQWLDGGDAVVEWLINVSAPALFMHHMGKVYRVGIDGDRATAHSHITAHITLRDAPETVVVSVGNYFDELRRADGGWKISVKDFSQGWSEARS